MTDMECLGISFHIQRHSVVLRNCMVRVAFEEHGLVRRAQTTTNHTNLCEVNLWDKPANRISEGTGVK